MKVTGAEVSLGEESCGHRSLDSLSTCRDCGRSFFDTVHSLSCNTRGYVVRGGSRSQENSQYYSSNRETRVDIEGRGGYRSKTNQYYSHNQGDRGRLLNLIGGTVGGDERVRYRSQAIQSYQQRGDSKGDGEIRVIRYEPCSMLEKVSMVMG